MGLAQWLLVAAIVAGAALTVLARAPLAGLIVAVLATAALATTIAGVSAGRAATVKATSGQTVRLTAAEARGRALFAARCSNCHVLRAAGAGAKVGPDLDFLRPPPAVVRRRIREGSQAAWAAMPPKIYGGRDADDVAAFVSRVAGR
jgi:mono/diheme cytochrome c family protein